MLLSAAMISFQRIMQNININTYGIDFSSASSGREVVFERRKGGFSCSEFNLVVLCWHRYPEIQTCLRACSVSLLDPILLISSPRGETHRSEGKKEAPLALPPLSCTNDLQPLPTEPQRSSEGAALRHFHGEKRPSTWVFNGNPALSFLWA